MIYYSEAAVKSPAVYLFGFLAIGSGVLITKEKPKKD